jgi:RNA polymerase sigma factor (sigma-70 family)
MTVLKLKSAGLMKEDRKTAVQKTEELLRNYPKFKLSDQEHTKELCRKIETALDTIRSDYYFEVISLYYFERYTREEVAVHFNTSETTISRNKSRLLSELAAVLFSDDFIYEIFL